MPDGDILYSDAVTSDTRLAAAHAGRDLDELVQVNSWGGHDGNSFESDYNFCNLTLL